MINSNLPGMAAGTRCEGFAWLHKISCEAALPGRSTSGAFLAATPAKPPASLAGSLARRWQRGSVVLGFGVGGWGVCGGGGRWGLGIGLGRGAGGVAAIRVLRHGGVEGVGWRIDQPIRRPGGVTTSSTSGVQRCEVTMAASGVRERLEERERAGPRCAEGRLLWCARRAAITAWEMCGREGGNPNRLIGCRWIHSVRFDEWSMKDVSGSWWIIG